MNNELEQTENTSGRKKFKLFNVNKDGIDFKVINNAILFLSILASIVLAIFVITLVRDIVISPITKFFSIVAPFIIGIVLAWLLTPIVDTLQEKRGYSRRKASFIVSFLGILLITVLIVGIVYAVSDTLVNFLTGGKNLFYFLTTSDFDTMVKIIEENINATSNNSSMSIFITVGEYIGLFANHAGRYVVTIPFDKFNISAVFKFLYQYVIIATVAAFLLPEFRGLGKVFKGVIPKKYKDQGSDLVDIVADSFTSYMNGAIKIALIIGTSMFFGFITIAVLANFPLKDYAVGGAFIAGSPSEWITVILIIFVFAILAGTTNLIPYAGPFIGGVPIVLLVFLTDQSNGSWVTISVGAWIVVMQSLESLFLQPLIMGRSTKMHPVIILLGLTVFANWFGLVGMLISTPILAITKSVIRYYDDIYEIF